MSLLKAQIICLTILIILTLPSTRAEIYKWTDERGRIHYGDRPDSDNAEQINYKNKSPATTGEERSWEEIQSRQRKFLDYLEYERGIRNEKKQAEEQELAEIQRRCAEAIAYRDELNEFPVFYREGDNGNREFLSADEKDEEIRRTQDFISRNCRS